MVEKSNTSSSARNILLARCILQASTNWLVPSVSSRSFVKTSNAFSKDAQAFPSFANRRCW